MRVRRNLKLGLTLTVAMAWLGCREDLIQLTLDIEVPDSVTFDRVTVVRLVGSETVPQIDARLPQAEPGGRKHTAGIFVPKTWSEISVRAWALYDGRVVAETELAIGTQVGRVPLRLVACHPPFLPTQAAGLCQSQRSGGEPPDGGATGPEDGPAKHADTGTGDRTGDNDGIDGSTTRWMPAACMTVDKTVMPPLPAVPLPVDPHCKTYCDAMQASCEFVYGEGPAGMDRCLLTCTKLAWPVPTGSSDQDDLTCRIAWAQAAGRSPIGDRANRCIYASLNSSRACGDACQVYCNAGNAICPGGYFPPPGDCPALCRKAEREFMKQAPAGRTFEAERLGCRLDELQRAVFNPARCTFAAPNACPGQPCQEVVFPVD